MRKKKDEIIITPPASDKPYGYIYDTQQILLTIQCAIQGSAGFRCVSRIFNIIHDSLSLHLFPTPVFSTIRDWILKLGLYNLTKPRDKGEWVWIVDFSVQMGAMRCLLILGVRMEALKDRGHFKLSHKDVEPIILKTVESCPGEIVKMALDEAKSKTGKAIAIVSDGGSEIKRGVRLFLETLTETEKPTHLYDIMHKADLVLKKELAEDHNWENFTKEMTNTLQQLKQGTSSHLIPPKQYQKKRRMRCEIDNIEWGIKILAYLESGKANNLEKDKLSWVFNYRSCLNGYKAMALLFDMCTKEVREHGYSSRTMEILKEQGEELISDQRSKSFFSKLLSKVEEETNKIPEGECLPGCSEVIESVFGKFKQLEKQHASLGITSLVLSIPSLLGEVAEDTVKKAMEAISIGQIKEWVKVNLEDTFWSLRRRDLNGKDCKDNSYLDSDELPLEEIA